MIPLLSFTQPAPSSTNTSTLGSGGGELASNAYPPSYDDALELGPASATDHHPPIRLRSLYRANRYGSSRWRELKEHVGSMHHLLPEPVLTCVHGAGAGLGRFLSGFYRRTCTCLTCSCMPPQQRLSLAFAFLSFVTVLLIVAQPWMDTSGLVQGGMTAEEVSEAITRPDLVLADNEAVEANATWHWKRCSSEGEALRWQRKTYCTSITSFSFSLPTQIRADDTTLEILLDRVSLETDRLAANGKVPPGGTSSGTAPGKVEVLVDHGGQHTRYTNNIKVELLAKYDEDAQPMLEKSTVVVTKVTGPDNKNLHRIRILTPTLPDFFSHEFNNVWFPHAPLQMSVKVWVPPVTQLRRDSSDERKALPRLRIATAVADVGILRMGSGLDGIRLSDGTDEDEFALKGRALLPTVDGLARRRPAPGTPSAAYFSSIQVSTLSGRIGVGAHTILAANHSIELRTHFPHSGVYADAVERAGRDRGNRLSSFGSLRAGRGRGQIDVHGSVVLSGNDNILDDLQAGPNWGAVLLSTQWSTDSIITIWRGAVIRSANLQIDADPAGIFLQKGSKFVKDHMIVKGPIKHE